MAGDFLFLKFLKVLNLGNLDWSNLSLAYSSLTLLQKFVTRMDNIIVPLNAQHTYISRWA